MRQPLTLALTLGLMTSPGISQDQPAPLQMGADLRSYVEHITGSTAVDCGRLGIFVLREEMERTIACGVNAAARHTPFVFVKAGPAIDSMILEGLLGDS